MTPYELRRVLIHMRTAERVYLNTIAKLQAEKKESPMALSIVITALADVRQLIPIVRARVDAMKSTPTEENHHES